MSDELFKALRDLQSELNSSWLIESFRPDISHDRYQALIEDDRKAYIERALPKLKVVNEILVAEGKTDLLGAIRQKIDGLSKCSNFGVRVIFEIDDPMCGGPAILDSLLDKFFSSRNHNSSSRVSGTGMPAASIVEEARVADVSSFPSATKPEGRQS